MRDPGLTRHEWQTEWKELAPLVVDSPGEALPELDGLVRRMAVERGYPLEEGKGDAAAEEGVEPEVLAGLRAAREITALVERGEDVDPAEVAQVVALYRELFDHLLTRQSDEG
jgi:hypothetical protein